MLWRVPARRRRPPARFIEPCLATVAAVPPAGDGWTYEIKHDGYRLQVHKGDDRVRLFTRRGFDWTDRYPLVRTAAAALEAGTLVMDGELVCLDERGIADFGRLHSRCHDAGAIFYAFDLLSIDGEDLRREPLALRKARLGQLLGGAPRGLHYVDHDAGDGKALYRAACRMGIEGLIAKKLTSPYRSGRSKSWLKIKNPRAPGALRLKDGLEG